MDLIKPSHYCDWMPLYTQQLRLRHLIRIIGYNISYDPSVSEGLYYTLHLTSMCAPSYVSEKVQSRNPKWTEICCNEIDNSPDKLVVVRVWKQSEKRDSAVTVWGVSFSGLVYLGTKLAEVQPEHFCDNTLIFQLRGGFFTSKQSLKKNYPFVGNLNVVLGADGEHLIARHLDMEVNKHDVRRSYTVEKLRRLHSVQISIKNEMQSIAVLKEKIQEKSPLSENVNEHAVKTPTPRNKPLSLHDLLAMQQVAPISKCDKVKMFKLQKEIEQFQFKCRLLAEEKERILARGRKLTVDYNNLCDANDSIESTIKEGHRELGREYERAQTLKRNIDIMREKFVHVSAYVKLRKKELMNQLLEIFHISETPDQQMTICDIVLPPSEKLGKNCDDQLSENAALGYVTHATQMCSHILQLPLRYPVYHYGSMSKIYDYITKNLPDDLREFPLHSRTTKEKNFEYAVFLLNINIAQLLVYCGLSTRHLPETLRNLLVLLRQDPPMSNMMSKNLELVTSGSLHVTPTHQIRRFTSSNQSNQSQSGSEYHVDLSVETGLDPLDPLTPLLVDSTSQCLDDRLSHRSGDSLENNCETKSLVSTSTITLSATKDCSRLPPDSSQVERSNFLHDWLSSGPALICADESLYPEEIIGHE